MEETTARNEMRMQVTNDSWIGRTLRVLPLVSLTLVTGCLGSGGSKTEEMKASDRDWLQPSPILEEQIKDEAARLPWTHGFERLEQIRWFASIGEPAYPSLLELANDERDDVAAAALAALGASMDRRLVSSLQELDWVDERRGSDLELEYARTLVRLGDWSELPVLIRGLKDERLYTRSLCAEALKEATHETHGYNPRAEATERELAVERWERWWLSRSGEGILSGN